MNDMRDPNTANSRIYVGNLKENTSKAELVNIFGKYGSIRGVLVSRNFGFIQFDKEQSVTLAIENEHQQMYGGRNINVSRIQKKVAQKNNNSVGSGGGSGGGADSDGNQSNASSSQNTSPSGGNMQNAAQINKSNNAQLGNKNSNAPQMNKNIIGPPNKGNNGPPLNKGNNGPQMNKGNQGPQMNKGNNGPPMTKTINNGPPMNNSSNNSNVNSNNMQQNPSAGNQQQRQPWRNNNNNNNNNNYNQNEMNFQSDNDRVPFDTGRDMSNERWNQDNSSNNTNNYNNSNSKNYNNNNCRSNMRPSNPFNRNNSNDNRDNTAPPPFENRPYKSVLSGGVLQGYASAKEVRSKFPDANVCEIIVVDKGLVEFAEYVESRIKTLNISVDLLFPNADLTCGRMLSNIANRGALFAIIINIANREMRSLTVNVLYGIPAEHRNMPLEDALELISRNFEQLQQGDEGDIIGDTDDSPYAAIPKSLVRHPDSVQHLMNLLGDNRNLTVSQFDCVIKYLQDRREQQHKFESGDTDVEMKPSGSETNASGKDSSGKERAPSPQIDPEEDMQRRLMEILNKPTISNINIEPPEKKAKIEQEPALLNDPKVKNALDSLFDF